MSNDSVQPNPSPAGPGIEDLRPNLHQMVRQGLHFEAFLAAVANGLDLTLLQRALGHGLMVDKFSPLLEFGCPIKLVNDALEIACDEHENIPHGKRRIGRAQFGGDLDYFLERIWLLPVEG